MELMNPGHAVQDQELDSQASLGPWRRGLAMFSLILAGEAIFVPIYHLNRYFKSSFLDTFSINESQLGDVLAGFGIVSMVCYLLGGPLADRYSPRRLLTGSLVVTGGGSLYMATFPSLAALKLLYLFWGISAILAFWAPLLRATREWGGQLSQGKAFGLLEGGRGLLSALIASVAATLFTAMVGDSSDTQLEVQAVKYLLWFYSSCCMVAAGCVMAFLPDSPAAVVTNGASRALGDQTKRTVALGSRVLAVARLPAVWLQAIIILTAYTAFRGFDNYGRYAEVAYGISESDSAQLIAMLSYLRAFAALGAGWVADRFLGVARTIAIGFATLIVCFGLLLTIPTKDAFYYVAVGNMAASSLAFFGLRGIYFAMFEESGVPRPLTGIAVGVVSFIGYTPDIFFSKLYGWLVNSARDAGDEMLGYQRLWILLLVFSVAGLLASLLLRRCSAQSKLAASSSREGPFEVEDKGNPFSSPETIEE